METAFARAEQRLETCIASDSNRNWRAVSQPTLYRIRPKRLHDADRAVVCLFRNCGGFPLPRRQMGVLCHVPALFLAFMIPLPEAAVDFLENASKEASAEVANWLF